MGARARRLSATRDIDAATPAARVSCHAVRRLNDVGTRKPCCEVYALPARALRQRNGLAAPSDVALLG
jgi:hypothetical protein